MQPSQNVGNTPREGLWDVKWENILGPSSQRLVVNIEPADSPLAAMLWSSAGCADFGTKILVPESGARIWYQNLVPEFSSGI